MSAPVRQRLQTLRQKLPAGLGQARCAGRIFEMRDGRIDRIEKVA